MEWLNRKYRKLDTGIFSIENWKMENELEELKEKKGKLQFEKNSLEEVTAELKFKLDAAKGKAKKAKKYADVDWFNQTNKTISKNNRRIQQLAREIGEINREIKKRDNEGMDKFFVDAAKEILDNKTFYKVLDLAKLKAGI